MQWVINEAPVQLICFLPAEEAHWMPQTCNLDGIPININEENSTSNFRVQSEREWTLNLLTLSRLSGLILTWKV